MQAGQNHAMVRTHHQLNQFEQQLYPQLWPLAHQILQVLLENQSEESVHAFTVYLLEFSFSDGNHISGYIPPQSSETVLKGKALEALAHWISLKTGILDALVPHSQNCSNYIAEQLAHCKRQLEQASYQSDPSGVLVEFTYSILVELLGTDAACLASALGGELVALQANAFPLMEYPVMLLTLFVRRLEELQAKTSKVIMELYNDAGLMAYEDSKSLLMCFFRHYTVQTTSGTLEVHESSLEPVFMDSPFKVALIDSFGSLMKLLMHLEDQVSRSSEQTLLAVDFEGMKLCRLGPLCLIQMTVSDDPTLVYVLDVHVLGRKAFTLTTPNGTSMKRVLEEQSIRKVWFDPRNDVDALYHQFEIMPRGIFDLQLAEVADRRSRGLNVHYVQGLHKCLAQCSQLHDEGKVFAERINTLGKSLFEPQNGGDYEVFRRRPLHPVILVYAAHDSRYMLMLYHHYLSAISRDWIPRVLAGSEQRARWCLNEEYIVPNSEAPEF